VFRHNRRFYRHVSLEVLFTIRHIRVVAPGNLDFRPFVARNIQNRVADRRSQSPPLSQHRSTTSADLRAQIEFDRIGILCFSFAGSTEAEAATFDPRIAA
jgi:hypothetical protein